MRFLATVIWLTLLVACGDRHLVPHRGVRRAGEPPFGTFCPTGSLVGYSGTSTGRLDFLGQNLVRTFGGTDIFLANFPVECLTGITSTCSQLAVTAPLPIRTPRPPRPPRGLTTVADSSPSTMARTRFSGAPAC